MRFPYVIHCVNFSIISSFIMGFKNAKFLCNILSQELQIKSVVTFFKSYSASKCGNDPCKPTEKCKKEDSTKQKDFCGSKSESPSQDRCNSENALEYKSPCMPRTPTGSIVIPPTCAPSCCPAIKCPDLRGKHFCSPAVLGKVAIITGGANGIGLHIALAILKNGGKVFLGDTQVEAGKNVLCQMIDTFGENKAAFIKCDVTKAEDMKCLFKAAIKEFKQIDIVVNNAGIFSNNLVDRLVEVNIKGVIRGTFLGFKYMRRNRTGGTIINIGSISAYDTHYAEPLYVGSKIFVSGFSKSMGHDYFFKQTGVKVMAMCPGVTMTPMVTDVDEASSVLDGFGKMDDILREQCDELPSQSVEECGMHIIRILEVNVNGSEWISEGDEIYRIKTADRHTLRTCQ
ncbi:hypothetical protein WA026_018986 [Henosepilachna vigintioctopunctata]|uniref:Uncharacterized protein n=1 Tax=Henosepilachna vigintioctopunctata TaxID=420089 RepID=A0AAW1V8Z0_9CUCU